MSRITLCCRHRGLCQRHRCRVRVLIIGLVGLLAIPAGKAWAAGEVPEEDKPPPAVRPRGMESYCGVQSLYRALRALGKEVSFADLVKPEYISSREGSTVADLKKAATDLGGFLEPMSRMTSAMLQQH